MVRTPSERVANPVPFAAFDLLVDRKFVAKFPKTFIGEFFGPEYTKYASEASVNEDLKLSRDGFGNLPRFYVNVLIL